MRDIFRPKNDPERTIYDALQKEAEKRQGRTVDEWIAAERLAIRDAANEMAERHGLMPPTLMDIADAETYGMGHVDYGAKLAYRLVRIMRGETK